jgi:cytochrome P450
MLSGTGRRGSPFLIQLFRAGSARAAEAARSGYDARETLRAGDAVLVLLAAANRDPAVQPDPGRFDPFRQEPRSFTFGAGAHACPGQALAVTIARAGVERLILAGLDLERFAAAVTYRPSANVRIPERTV